MNKIIENYRNENEPNMQKYEIRKNKSFKVYFCSDALGCLAVETAVSYAAAAAAVYVVYNILDDSYDSDECESELKTLSTSGDEWTIYCCTTCKYKILYVISKLNKQLPLKPKCTQPINCLTF